MPSEKILPGNQRGTTSPRPLPYRVEQHPATDQVQYLRDHIHFIQHEGRKILLLELANCTSAEVEKIFRALPEVVTTCPRGSVLVLSDFKGVSLGPEAIRVMQETAVFNKPYVKKSAVIGTQSLPPRFHEDMGSFSRREFPSFETRELALAWLVKD